MPATKFCLIWLLSIVTLSIQALDTHPLQYAIASGLSQQTIHILDINPDQVIMKIGRAKDMGQTRETVAAIAQYHHALAGINASFFRFAEPEHCVPAGILKLEGQWHGIAYKTRGAIGWSHNNQVLFDRLQTKTTLSLNGKQYPIQAMNQLNAAQNYLLFSDSFGPSLPNHAEKTYVSIQNKQVQGISHEKNITIPKNGYLYSPGKLLPPKEGDSATLNVILRPYFNKNMRRTWQHLPFIVGGAPLLIKDGIAIQDFQEEQLNKKFIDDKTARTVIATRPNGHILFIVVEQNPFLGKPGMSLPELTEYLLELGCNNALNLDGGSSSAFFIQPQFAQHTQKEFSDNLSPSMNRKVLDAILLMPKHRT